MKEFDLTTQAQKPYPENGDKYMTTGEPVPGEGQPEQSVTPHLPPNVEREQVSQQTPIDVSSSPSQPEEALQVDRASLTRSWEETLGKPYNRFTHEERQAIDLAIERGIAPGREDLNRVLREEGFSEEDISNASDDQIREVLRNRAGAMGGGNEPPHDPPRRPTATGGEGEENQEPLPDLISSDGITDPVMKDLINQYNARLNNFDVSKETLGSLWDHLYKRISENGFASEQEEIARRVMSEIGDLAGRVTAGERRRAKEIADENEARSREGIFGERKLTEDEKDLIRNARTPDELEKLFNRMFDRADTRPLVDFQTAFGSAGGYEFDQFMKTLNEEISRLKDEGVDIAGANALEKIVQQFTNEKEARELIHNAYFGILSGANTEGMNKFLDRFLSGWEDLAVRKPGVSSAMHFYEQALLITREERGGYLKPSDVVGEMGTNSEGKTNILARKFLEDANNRGSFKDQNGNQIILEPWQIDRALAFARGLLIINGRTIEIAASSILPEGAGSFTDQYAQRIIAELAPFRHHGKFIASAEYSHVLAFVMNRGRKPWSPKELEEFHHMNLTEKIRIINGLTKEGKIDDMTERFYSVLNPFEIGGVLSRTGWRLSKDSPFNLLEDLTSGGNEDWVGTGVQLERLRGRLTSGNKEAKDEARMQLKKIAERTPLRLLLNNRGLQQKVLSSWKIDGKEVTIGKKIDRETGQVADTFVLEESLTELVELQERVIIEKRPLDDFLHEATPLTQELVRRIRSVWEEGGEQEKFLDVLINKEWKTPYTFGTDDAPYDQYSFENTGVRSVARRWGDMASAAKASAALNEYLSALEHFKDPQDMVKAMKAIYDGIKGYNEDDAKKFIGRLAEGSMKFYGKSWMARMPLGIGTAYSSLTGKASYAQICYGRGAMAWDEFQSNEYTRLLRDTGMLTEKQQHELQERAGGGKKEVMWAYARTLVPLISLMVLYYILNKVAKEK